MSYDLTIHTQKSSTIPALEHVQSVHDDLRRSLNGSGVWFELGLHQPRAADAKWFMENDGLFDPQCKRAFEAFCRQHQLVSAPLSEEAALRFMLHEDGAHLASITLPSDEASCAAVFRVLVEFARRSGLRIRDPQASRDVDLESPGNYPPLWKG